MITSVEVLNAQGDTLTLQLEDPVNGYLVTSIDGLDPVPATIVSSSFAGQDGQQFQTSYRDRRNLMIKLGYDPDYAGTTVKSLRNNLYRFFMPKSNVVVKFYSDDSPMVQIEGIIEDFEAPLFAREPSAVVSVLCLLPDFYTPTPVVVEGVTVTGTTETAVPYIGTIETGVIFEMAVDRTISGFTVYQRTPNNLITEMEFAYPLLAGDILRISSVSGSKYATLTRAGEDSSVLYGVAPTSRWLELAPGDNTLRVVVAGAAIPWEISYTNKYGGL